MIPGSASLGSLSIAQTDVVFPSDLSHFNPVPQPACRLKCRRHEFFATYRETLTVRLSDKGEVPDRDFVLRWREQKPEGLAARCWICDRGQEFYALLEIRAPKASGSPTSMDFYFLVDRSGSMGGVKWEKAALAVQSAVNSLDGSDRAMVTLFSTQFNDFAEQPLPPGQLLRDSNFRSLGQLQPGGGTELGSALRHVLEVAAQHSRNRPKSLILITDAQVGNEAGILKLMEAAPEFPLHCFGVDVALNDALLLALARQQRGTFHSLNPGDDVAKAVTDLAQIIRHPVLKELQLREGWETSEAWIPPLYSGQVYYLSARSVTEDAIALTARNGDGATAQIPVASQTTSREAPYLHWCMNRIQRLIVEGQAAEAVALSVQSNLICPLTAFIAWDEAEKVAVAKHALVEPALMDEVAAAALCLSSEVRFASMGVRPSRSAQAPRILRRLMAKQVADGTLRDKLCVAPPQPSTCSPPPDPMSVLTQIVRHLHSDYMSRPPEPFTSEERRAAFNTILEEIRSRLNHPDWKPLCDAILDGVFSDPREAIRGSNLLAELLSRLAGQLNEIGALRQRILTQVGELRRASLTAAEALDRIEKTLQGDGPLQPPLTELLKALRPSRGLWRDTCLEETLAKIGQIEADIHEQLKTFLASVARK